ncbi:glutamine amidotransferase class-I family protein [Synechococcus sp. BOUM118]|nr:glutamine amidotransferase class-I family protein [Synechococcus sp. BOUM118]
MGWNSLNIQKPNHHLVATLPTPSRFYFVHSYCFKCENPHENSLATAFHGHSFDVMINSHLTYGVQFHPEKSHVYGLALFNQFASI